MKLFDILNKQTNKFNMLTYIYRKFIPDSIRHKIYNLFLGDALVFFRTFNQRIKCIFIYRFNFFYQKNDLNDAYAFMGKYGLTSYPFLSSLKYDKMIVEILHDEKNNLPYVIHHGKKLYFPKTRSAKAISNLYKSLLIEQDIDSPHKYVESYKDLEGKTLLDIGAAEGIFSLEMIDYVKYVYLFEYDNEWTDALNATFSPWKNKVMIVKKYVSEKSNGMNISINDFLNDKSKNDLFLKMDIEGAEELALRGAENILRMGENISLSVCTYHKKEDLNKFISFFSSLGYKYELTKGYMYWDERLSKGVIRVYK